MGQFEDQRRYKDKHKILGLCVCCSNKASDNILVCALCNYRNKIKTKKYYFNHSNAVKLRVKNTKQQRLLEGRCYCCGRPLIDDEKKYCVICVSNRNTTGIRGIV